MLQSAPDLTDFHQSPRVRGNLQAKGLSCQRRRSIPTCTGESEVCQCTTPVGSKVYPRMYEGTDDSGTFDVYNEGLSPRVRGNQSVTTDAATQTRSIPACTGEPVVEQVVGTVGQVYPRVYGGTRLEQLGVKEYKGLSPRVRGNLMRPGLSCMADRSIPACTGEPPPMTRGTSPWPVYPRVYGGTTELDPSPPEATGLSPRVRGNRHRPSDGGVRRRSIPACTGEPVRGMWSCPLAQVYPRVYGGTANTAVCDLLHLGLSPRVRGNRVPVASVPVDRRSIPACTGEPAGALFFLALPWVYPRVYGGTLLDDAAILDRTGLSPRVRGNLRWPVGTR